LAIPGILFVCVGAVVAAAVAEEKEEEEEKVEYQKRWSMITTFKRQETKAIENVFPFEFCVFSCLS
jgi:hypothetical protein